MRLAIQFLSILFIFRLSYTSCNDVSSEKWPTVGISVLVRNKEHTLPYFLSCLTEMDYPKDRLYIWIYSDFNEDGSIDILEEWAARHKSDYNDIIITANKTSGPRHEDEKIAVHWSPKHFKHVIRLREEALSYARKKWADFLFMLDADVFLTEKRTLKSLVRKDVPVVAPMLVSDGLYSNFWCGMNENYYYERTDDYKPILTRTEVGCFSVPMVHSAVLMSLRREASDVITYDNTRIKGYKGPEDDIIAFAVNAKYHGINLTVCNDLLYGFVPVPLEDGDDLTQDQEQLLNVKLEAISRGSPIPLIDAFKSLIKYPKRWRFGCDEIYMINLERRTERRMLMEMSFRELGMEVTTVKAVDGRNLDLNDLREYSATIMPNYMDPYHKRPMKAGEVGCFLSHYYVWEKVAKQRHGTALVLEDDIHFAPYFRYRFQQLLRELTHLDWDLVYIGRKILQSDDEEYATEHTVRPLYSYWTLGYLLSARGASKLLAAKPLETMLPVDEFLPIMFDQHPNDTWKSYFPNRNLLAFSSAPLLIHPTHYTGDAGYVSDTEDSTVLGDHGDRGDHGDLGDRGDRGDRGAPPDHVKNEL
ncbi:glycosyltransferase 25 family member [Cydia amplana]|uniref:glycosyltransferase 25 family member n=1 Tax=Cydia amplana TaxID=1869771 RepID=UPI002FE64A35